MKKVKFRVAITALFTYCLLFSGCGSGKTDDSNSNVPVTSESPLPVVEVTALPTPPVAVKNRRERSMHGHTRVDNYYWLNERENPEVIAYLNAENAYTRQVMADNEDLQEKLFDEIVSRIKQTDESVPYKKNGYFYYSRYEEGKEYPIYARKKESLEAKEEIMLNANERAEGKSYYAASGLNVSPDNRLMAFGEDTVSRRQYTLRFKNLDSGEILQDMIPNTTGSAVWANDNKTIFYTMKDPSLRSFKIFSHVLGTPVSQDKEVYHEAD